MFERYNEGMRAIVEECHARALEMNERIADENDTFAIFVEHYGMFIDMRSSDDNRVHGYYSDGGFDVMACELGSRVSREIAIQTILG